MRWFGLDYEWLEETFRTRETDIYFNNYQIYIRGNERQTYTLFVVPISHEKIIEK